VDRGLGCSWAGPRRGECRPAEEERWRGVAVGWANRPSGPETERKEGD